MTITESPAAAPARSATGQAPAPAAATGLYNLVTGTDHKAIGRLYIAFSALFFLAAAAIGIVNGIEKADTESLDVFNDITTYFQFFWMLRLGLVFLVVLPLFIGLATAIVPLQVGSPSLVFPRAAAAAFWTWLVGSGMLIASFATDGGLGELADGATEPDAVALTLVSLGMLIVSLCLAALCVATTVVCARTNGMSLRRVPLFSWTMLVSSFVWLATLPVLFANLVLTYVDYRHGQLAYGNPAAINQQFQWAFWQPQVYAYAIPVVGVMSEIVPVAARVRQKMHDVLLVAIGLFGLLSLGAFAQRADIQDNFLYPAVGFAALLPLLMLLGGWADSLRQGKPSTKGPLGALLLATVAVLMLLAGVASGALRVLDPLDLLGTSATDGVFTLVVLAGVAGAIAGTVYWSAKLTGRLFPEAAARTLALVLLGGIALAGIPDVISGFLDQPAGIVTGDVKDGVQLLNVISLVGWAIVALAALGFLASYGRLLTRGAKYAPNNPWQGHTLEWATVSPPPIGNFSEPVPLVRSERPLLDPAEPSANGGAA